MAARDARVSGIEGYDVFLQPDQGACPLWDCPKVVRDAVGGRVPPRIDPTFSDVVGLLWPIIAGLGSAVGLWLDPAFVAPLETTKPIFVAICVLVAFAITLPVIYLLTREDYRREKLLKRFRVNPEVYREKVFELAIGMLPSVDFAGQYHSYEETSASGRLEANLAAKLSAHGIDLETIVLNRGRPYLIHRYELVELRWGNWPNGATKNYVLGLAILWPERRLKFNIELDSEAHHATNRLQLARDRDRILTERGWFVRRLNPKSLADERRTAQTLSEVARAVTGLAMYAKDEPIGAFERWWVAWYQNKRLRALHPRRSEGTDDD